MKKIQTKYKEAILYMQEHPELSVTKIGEMFQCERHTLKKLYDNSASNDKQIHVFDNCRHSHLRYDSKEEYDNLVISFLKNHNNS